MSPAISLVPGMVFTSSPAGRTEPKNGVENAGPVMGWLKLKSLHSRDIPFKTTGKVTPASWKAGKEETGRRGQEGVWTRNGEEEEATTKEGKGTVLFGRKLTQ